MATVTLGDGRSLTVGDDFLKLSPADQQSWVNDVAATLPKKDAPTSVEGSLRALDAGVASGVASTLGTPRALVDIGAKGLEAATNKVSDFLGVERYKRPDGPSITDKILPTTEQFQKAIQDEYYGDNAKGGLVQRLTKALDPERGGGPDEAINRAKELVAPSPPSTEKPYEPQNTTERYLKTGGELSGAALGGEGGLVRRLAQVAIPATISETAGHATEGTKYEPWARVAGAVVPGAAIGMAAQRMAGVPATIERQLPAGITGAHVDDAERLIQDAAARGVQLTWPEALSQVAQRPVLSETMRHVEATVPDAADFYATRPQNIARATDASAARLSPGGPAVPSSVGPAAGRAAGEALDETRGAINAAADPYYAATHTETVPAAEMARLRRAPGWDEASNAVRNDRQLNRYVAGAPDDSVAFVNEVRKYLVQQGENATQAYTAQGRNMQRAAGYQADAAAADRAARAGSPIAYDMAQSIERDQRAQYLQPMLEGPLGRLAKDDISTQNAIKALFPKDPLAHSEGEIGDAVTQMIGPANGPQRAIRERAASDLVRAHVEATFNSAARDLQSGPNQAGGAKFRAALVGSPQQRANLQAAVEALPDGAARWQGFNRYLDILEATGTRQNIGSKTAYNAEALKDLGGGGPAKTVASMVGNFPASVLKPLAEKYDRFRLGRNLDELSRTLTDPRSAGLLRNLAETRPYTQRGVNLARALAYTSVPSQRLYVSPNRDEASP